MYRPALRRIAERNVFLSIRFPLQWHSYEGQQRAVTRASFSDVTGALSRAAVPTRELCGPGHVAVTLGGGRIVALAFTKDGLNLLWSNPQLTDTDLVRNQPEKLVGGLGGDRLWFAPELDYHWKGVPDWVTVANYEVPISVDPGAYRFNDVSSGSIALHNSGQLLNRSNNKPIGFDVTRTIRMAPCPFADKDTLRHSADYTGIETSHVLQFDSNTNAGRLDLWHLLQVPVGSVLIVPLKEQATNAAKVPLSYALPGGWIQRSDTILWKYGGTAQAKIGVSASALTGRTAVLQQLESSYCLIIRDFHVDAQATYADHPHGEPREDQAFQAWDGMGFGEMEYHSPTLDAQAGLKVLAETDRLWAFGGTKSVINAISERLLQRNLSDAFMLLDAK